MAAAGAGQHNVRGVFPDVYAAWELDPEAACAILKAALLDKRCRPSMYACKVWDLQSCSFLPPGGVSMTTSADIASIARCGPTATHPSGHAEGQPHLYPVLKESVWQLLSSSRMRNWNTVLMREALVLAYGSDDAVATELRQRLMASSTPAAAFPILHILCDRAVCWRPTGVAARRHAGGGHSGQDQSGNDEPGRLAACAQHELRGPARNAPAEARVRAWQTTMSDAAAMLPGVWRETPRTGLRPYEPPVTPLMGLS